MTQLQQKLGYLSELFQDMGSVAVGFSAGVDSTLLLAVAHGVLGDSAVAFTAISPFFPEREREQARLFCQRSEIRQVEVPVDPWEIPGVSQNPPNRCYLCKRHLLSQFLNIARREGLAWVCEGSNLDDLEEDRPGLRAVAELGIRSPLREVGLTKAEIRQLSRQLGLPTWDKPSYACLASRFAYGEPIAKEELSMVDRGEKLLMDLGFRQVRVRVHGRLARVEVLPEAVEQAAALRETIVPALKALGFAYVTLDLEGFRTGSMHETLNRRV